MRPRQVVWTMREICCDHCERYEECPIDFECEKIKEIGDRIEDLRNDHSNLGIE